MTRKFNKTEMEMEMFCGIAIILYENGKLQVCPIKELQATERKLYVDLINDFIFRLHVMRVMRNE